MLGLDYRSDSEDESTGSSPPNPVPVGGETTSSNSSSIVSSSLTSKLNLPPPANTSSSSSSSSKVPSLPPPKAKKIAAPKKILVELPKIDKHASDDELSDELPAAKKPRLGRGKGGASSLLSMLPAPKKAVPELSAPERVLGGGRPGVMYFGSSQKRVAPEKTSSSIKEDTDAYDDTQKVDDESATSLIPPSMLLRDKRKTQTTSSTLKPSNSAGTSSASVVDFFSLDSASSSRTTTPPSIPEPSVGSSSAIPSSISAAPKIEEFRPPSPKIDDPYPGYYQLPSGAWAVHDPEYYKTYADRWQKEYEAQIRALERNRKGFEGAGANGEDAKEVKASALSDAARAAREEKKAITERAGHEADRPVPKVALNPTKMTGVARSRHQLHSLLADAFLNRDAIEEKIAQGKRNRKEAGNKYGF